MENELSGINFLANPIYEPKLKPYGKCRISLYEWGECKRVENIRIGKPGKDTKEFQIDTLIHEELEVRIAMKSWDIPKYSNLNDMIEIDRHKYINSIIKRFFRMKGWNYELA